MTRMTPAARVHCRVLLFCRAHDRWSLGTRSFFRPPLLSITMLLAHGARYNRALLNSSIFLIPAGGNNWSCLCTPVHYLSREDIEYQPTRMFLVMRFTHGLIQRGFAQTARSFLAAQRCYLGHRMVQTHDFWPICPFFSTHPSRTQILM